MGNGCSIFGSPQKCSGCGTEELHACKWKILYENDDIDEHYKNKSLFENPDLDLFGSYYGFANNEIEGVSHIVGKVSWEMRGRKIKLYQFLCSECRDKIQLEKLPNSWLYEESYNEKGYELIMLP